MEDAKKVLDDLGVRFWLEGGTLLGFRRSGYFIEWDHNADFLVFSEDIYPYLSDMEENLIKLEFNVKVKKQRKYGSRGGAKEDGKYRSKIVAVRNGDPLNICSYFLNGVEDLRVRIPYRFPNRLFDNNNFIEIEGVSYPCPNPVEEYLELAYGYWREPIQTKRSGNYRRGKGTTDHNAIDMKYKELYKEGVYKYGETKIYHGYKILEGE